MFVMWERVHVAAIHTGRLCGRHIHRRGHTTTTENVGNALTNEIARTRALLLAHCFSLSCIAVFAHIAENSDAAGGAPPSPTAPPIQAPIGDREHTIESVCGAASRTRHLWRHVVSGARKRARSSALQIE